VTLTSTATPTITITPTVTITPVPYPYTITIEAYNSAGEKVRLIGEALITNPVGMFDVMYEEDTTTVFNPYFYINDPDSQGLMFRFHGINTPDQRMTDYSDFYWTGVNDNGQPLENGQYYIQIKVKDEFGHTETVNYELMIMRVETYIQLSIYNSAGELVRRIKQPGPANSAISLGIDDVVYVGKGEEVLINYAEGETLVWDGKNEFGYMVGSGVYEMSIEVLTDDGFKVTASKSVTILNESGSEDILGDISVVPNPVVVTETLIRNMELRWTGSFDGQVRVRIFNMSGELVRELFGSGRDPGISWDMRTVGGSNAAGGLYIAVLEAKKDTGETERKIAKIALITKIDPFDDDILN